MGLLCFLWGWVGEGGGLLIRGGLGPSKQTACEGGLTTAHPLSSLKGLVVVVSSSSSNSSKFVVVVSS